MKAHLSSISAVFEHLKTTEKGLTSSEAQNRIEKYGKNKLVEAKKETIIQRFLKQLADPMIIILLVAAAISAVVAVIEHEPPTDVFIILFVVILNSVLGVIQESKAEKAIDTLKEMTAATSKVLRDGELLDKGSVSAIPCSISSVSDRNNYQPTPLSGKEFARVKKKIIDRSKGFDGIENITFVETY